jgi:preprotein translocase subunit SecG
MQTAVIVIHIVASLALILIVLLQTGRGAEMGAAFGGASQTLFGGSGGTTFMSKLTTVVAVLFMVTCLGLTYLSSAPQEKSIMENVPVEKPQGPALPEAKPVQPMPGQSGSTESTTPKQESAATPEKAAPQAQEATKQEAGTAATAQSQGAKPEPSTPASSKK